MDRNKYGVNLIEYVEKGVICKRIQQFETPSYESICSELKIPTKKWLCFSIYGPPTPGNLASFFEQRIDCLTKGSDSNLPF